MSNSNHHLWDYQISGFDFLGESMCIYYVITIGKKYLYPSYVGVEINPQYHIVSFQIFQ